MKLAVFVIALLVLPFAYAQEYAPGELIVKVKQNSVSTQLSSFIPGYLESKQMFPEKQDSIAKNIGLDRIYVVKVNQKTDIAFLANQVNKNPSVEYAEPNYILHASMMPSDPNFWRQWNLHNTGALAGSTADADIDAPEAFDITTGSSNIKIAVLDTGVHLTHEDLQANIWTNPNEILNGIDDDSNGKIDDINGWDFVASASGCESREDCSVEDNDPSDASGHGTQVSGVATARMNNGAGIAGVCPNCKIIPIRSCFLTTSLGEACYGTYVANGIIYSTDLGANILSMSFVFTSPVQVISDALTYASAHEKILIAGAGNDGGSALRYPAADAGVIAVAATNWNDQRASYSNYGSWIDLAAPGGITGARSMIYTTQHSVYSGGDYTYSTGTSLATPHVSGMAGLILSRYSNLTKAQVDYLLVNSVDTITTDQPIGSGRINAFKAVSWKCSDNTVLKQCSTNKPKFCDFDASYNLVLVDKCQQCGCAAGYSCEQESGICYETPRGGGSPLILKVATIYTQDPL